MYTILLFSLFNFMFTLIFFFTKKNYKNMNNFLDAFYYTLNNSTTLGCGDIVPETDIGKIITIIHTLFVYFSVSKLVSQFVLKNSKIKLKV